METIPFYSCDCPDPFTGTQCRKTRKNGRIREIGFHDPNRSKIVLLFRVFPLCAVSHVIPHTITVDRILVTTQEFVSTRSYFHTTTNASAVIRSLEDYVTREFGLAAQILVKMAVYAVIKIPVRGTNATVPSLTKVQTALFRKTFARRILVRIQEYV